jgi:hypothetical protein
MARGTSTSQQSLPPEQEYYFDPAEIVLLPMHSRTYKALADAALRDGIPLAEFLQLMFERAAIEGVRRK